MSHNSNSAFKSGKQKGTLWKADEHAEGLGRVMGESRNCGSLLDTFEPGASHECDGVNTQVYFSG
jgi:hypothetical protein